MKKYYFVLTLIITLFIFQNCQPLTSIYIETAVPAEINFPGDYKQIVFINLENDLNNDHKIDTLLTKIITEEMSFGFFQSIQSTLGIDSSKFLYLKGFPLKEKLYVNDTIRWTYLKEISGNKNADIFIILDSLKLTMSTEDYIDYYTYPTEYYKNRELAVSAHWSVFDLFTKKRLDKYNYKDTLYWEATSYSKEDLEDKLPSVERSIRETSYFTAVDYANRIFPGWIREVRYYFVKGNKDFTKAAELAKQEKWDQASELWKPYVDYYDKEIASRAAYNLALASELKGQFIKAIGWAERSNQIKQKTRTTNYIYRLKQRQKQLVKIQQQVY